MGNRVFVAGVGMTKFEKPGRRDWDYPDMVREAGSNALTDAGIDYTDVEQVVAGFVAGDSCSGQRAVGELGWTGVPVYNVNNNCSTGSTALVLGRQLVEGGLADIVLAVGFEKMQRGSLSGAYTDREPPLAPHARIFDKLFGTTQAPLTLQMFAGVGVEHMSRYGSTAAHFGKVAEKNHRHSANNPNAQFRDVYTLEQILSSPMIQAPLTKLQCSPTSDGSAAVVLMSERAIQRHGLASQAVEIAGQSMMSDTDLTFDPPSAISAVGYHVAKAAAREAYNQAGLGPEDVQVVELHDCFSTNEIVTYEALGLAPEGKGHLLIEDDATSYGGRWVVNPSGGLIAKGHPLGATGLAQCTELTWQLRGRAGPRQVDGARAALQHNLGLGTACVVTVYRKPEFAAEDA
jgi:acetyl-CoA acyltransferase